MARKKIQKPKARLSDADAVFGSPPKRVGRPNAAELKRRRGRTKKPYDVEKMREAAARVKAKEINLRQAVELYGKYGVKQTTLYDIVKGKTSPSRHSGHKAKVSSALQDQLAQWVITKCALGFAPTKLQIMRKIKQALEATGVRFDTKDGLPSRKWFKRWLYTHPEVSKRRRDVLDRMRAGAANPDTLKHFLDLYAKVREELGFADEDVWNLDESGFEPDKGEDVVFGIKGVKTAYQRGSKTSKHHTVGLCSNCISHMPPFFLIPGKSVEKDVLEHAPSGWMIRAVGKKGSNDVSVMVDWLKHFARHVGLLDSQGNRVPGERKVLLIVDAHFSHEALPVVDMARDLGIHMITFPGHLTHVLQPQDVAIIRPLKKEYCKHLDVWRSENQEARMTTKIFVGLLAKAWHVMTSALAEKAFRATGLVPVNSSALMQSSRVQAKLLPSLALRKEMPAPRSAAAGAPAAHVSASGRVSAGSNSRATRATADAGAGSSAAGPSSASGPLDAFVGGFTDGRLDIHLPQMHTKVVRGKRALLQTPAEQLDIETMAEQGLLSPGKMQVFKAVQHQMLQRTVFNPLPAAAQGAAAAAPAAASSGRGAKRRRTTGRLLTSDEMRAELAAEAAEREEKAARQAAGRGRGRGRGRGGGRGRGRGGRGEGATGGGGGSAPAIIDDSTSGSSGEDDMTSEDEEEEEYEPLRVHDVKMGKVLGRRGSCILFQVEWKDFPDESDFTWEPYEHFGQHAKLADDFEAEWKAANKAWPPA